MSEKYVLESVHRRRSYSDTIWLHFFSLLMNKGNIINLVVAILFSGENFDIFRENFWIQIGQFVSMLRVNSGRGQFGILSPSAVFISTSNRRAAAGVIKAIRDDPTKLSIKHAILSARKKDRIKLPRYKDGYHISDFLNHTSGIEAMLNVDAMEKYEALDSNTYRCRIPAIHFLNFDVAPVLDLVVNPTTEDCTVEMLSCKFEGSDIMERQNEQFSASMKNHITWKKHESESFLYADVKLSIKLKIQSKPFNMLPVSAVERPGNIMMGALLDRFVPLLLQQMLRDYDDWVKLQSGHSP